MNTVYGMSVIPHMLNIRSHVSYSGGYWILDTECIIWRMILDMKCWILVRLCETIAWTHWHLRSDIGIDWRIASRIRTRCSRSCPHSWCGDLCGGVCFEATRGQNGLWLICISKELRTSSRCIFSFRILFDRPINFQLVLPSVHTSAIDPSIHNHPATSRPDVARSNHVILLCNAAILYYATML